MRLKYDTHLLDWASASSAQVIFRHNTVATIIILQWWWRRRIAWEGVWLRHHIARAVANNLLEYFVVVVSPWLITHAVALHLIIDGHKRALCDGWPRVAQTSWSWRLCDPRWDAWFSPRCPGSVQSYIYIYHYLHNGPSIHYPNITLAY